MVELEIHSIGVKFSLGTTQIEDISHLLLFFFFGGVGGVWIHSLKQQSVKLLLR